MKTENKGRRIRLILMEDPYPLEPGTEGVVQFEDDLGQIHVDWDNGSRLAIIPEKDKFEYIDDESSVEEPSVEESTKITKFGDFLNEERDHDIFGTKKESNPHSRRAQNFYDHHTRQRVTGKSKYELNSSLFDLSKRKDEVGTMAQFCLQISRESIVSDQNINLRIEKLEDELNRFGNQNRKI